MDNGIKNILESEEKIFWQGIVNRKVLVFNFIIPMIIIFVVGALLFTKESIQYTSNGQIKYISGITVALVIVGAGTIFSLLSFLSNLVKEYAITQKRVIIKSGLIGTDFQSIYFEQIQEVIVDVGLIGKLFNVGTIKIDTGKTETYSSGTGNNRQIGTRVMYRFLSHIDKPYEIYQYINSALTERKESLYSGRADQQNSDQFKS